MAKKLSKERAAALYARLAALNPHPETELKHTNPFTLLVAVVLSAQATDVGVNKATRALFAVADTPQKMLALGEEKLGDYIKTIGLWRGKAKNVIGLSKILVEEHGGKVPAEREALQKLPGVGRKSANVVLNTAFGEPVVAVDTHVFRVANRTGLARGATPLDVERELEKITPKEYLLNAHHWLILHGRYICVARAPKCPICPISDICLYPDKTKTVPAPKGAAKPAAKVLGALKTADVRSPGRSSRRKPGPSTTGKLDPGLRRGERSRERVDT
jgi:endonuclease-3